MIQSGDLNEVNASDNALPVAYGSGQMSGQFISNWTDSPARGDEMRDFNRIMPMLERIEAIWKRNPDLRLMQLLGNVTGAGDPYYVEDDVLLEGLKRVYQHDQDPR